MKMDNEQDWDLIKRRFKAAGGILENVVLQSSEFGRGLFAVDPNQESRLVLPKNLLIPVDDITLRDGALSLKETSLVDSAARDFFEEYNSITSWGGGGKEQIRSFSVQMQMLPTASKDLLSKTFGFSEWFEPITDEFLLDRFMRSRRIGIDGKQYLMPMLELCNHNASGGPISITEGDVIISGKFTGEITWKYRTADTLQIFRGYGFASLERFSFSIPFEVTDQRTDRIIRIGSNTSARVSNEANRLIPEVTVEEATADVSFFQLGDRLDPRNGPRMFLSEIAPKLEIKTIEFFEGLLHYNRQALLDFLATVESDASPLIADLRKVVRLQLESLNMVSFQ